MLRRYTVYAVAALLTVFGAYLFGAAAYINAKGWVAQVLLERAWTERLHGYAYRDAKPWPWADTAPLARLSVPRLDIDQIVLVGASGRVLAFGPAHLSGTALPGDLGHSVITGHRDTHFKFLKDLRPDDVVTVQTPDGSYVDFSVIGGSVFDARTARLTVVENRKVLTLVTCYPFNSIQTGQPLRYAVFAEAI